MSNDLFQLHSASDSWQRVLSQGEAAPIARTGHTLTAAGEMLVLFGGASHIHSDGRPMQRVLGDCWVFWPRWAEWQPVKREQMPSARCGHAAAAAGDDRVVIFGHECTHSFAVVAYSVLLQVAVQAPLT